MVVDGPESSMTTIARPLALATLFLLLAIGSGGGHVYAEDDDNGGGEAQPPAEWAAYTSGLHAQGISSLRIHPKDPEVFYAHVHGMGAARSTDGGKTWTAIMEGVKPTPAPRSTIRLTFDPNKPRWLYMVVEGQVYRSEDRGDTWTNISSGALASYTWDRRDTANLVWEVRVNPTKSSHLLLGTFSDGLHHGGLYESRDSGKTWNQIAGSTMRSGLGEAGHDTFLVRIDPKTEKNIMIAGREHVWSSDDRGTKFTPVPPGGKDGALSIRGLEVSETGKLLYLADAEGLWLMKGFGRKWSKKPSVTGDITGIFTDPRTQKRLFAVFADKGPMVSEDSRHRKWELLGGDEGYAAAEIGEIVGHPKEKDTTYFTSPATGLHLSLDEGKTIAPIAEANLPTFVPGLADVAVHPAEGHVHLALTEHGILFRSEDDGVSWTRGGRVGQRPHRVIADPKRKGGWFATGRQLLFSKNDGNFWDVVYTPESPHERVLDVRRVGEDGLLLAVLERSGKLLTSEDDGETWTESTAPPISDGTWVTGIDVNPADPNHVVMATTTLSHNWSDKDMNGGVFQTLDGGASWQDMSFNLKPGKKDSANDRRLKANWNRGQFVAFDPASNLIVYGTNGGGLWARSLAKLEGDDAIDLQWYNVSPKKLPDGDSSVIARWADENGKSHWAMQLWRPGDAEAAFVSISGDDLAKIVAARRKDGEGEEIEGDEPPPWRDEAAPSTPLDRLHSDPRGGQRLVGADADGAGVLVFGGVRPPGATDDTADGPEEAAPVAYEPADGLRGFSASADQEINVWNLRDGKRGAPLRGHNAEVFAVALASDETIVATAGADGKVRIWGAADLGPLGELAVPGTPNCLAFDSDSSKLFVGCETWQIAVINKDTLEDGGVLEGHAGGVTALATADDANVLYSGSKDGTVRVWDVAQKKELLSIPFGGEVYSLAVSDDGKRIYVGGVGKTLRVYGPDGTELVSRDMPEEAVVSMALAPEGERLFVAGAKGIHVLSASDLADQLELVGPEKAVLCLTLSVDGMWALAGDADNGLWLWQTDIAEARWSNPGAHAGAVFAVALTPDETEREPPPPPADGPKPGDDAGKPGDAAAPGDGAKPADPDKPADGDKPVDGEKKPADGAKPAEGAPEDGAKPDDDKPKPDAPK